MAPTEIAFAILAVMAVGGGAMVAFSRRIVYAAFSLLFTFLGVAGLYVLLAADFLAIAQVIIYVGGILVLLLFGVMLTHRIYDVQLKVQRIQPILGGLAALVVLGVLLVVVFTTDWPVVEPRAPVPTTARIGDEFMRQYVFPFEFVSLILLVALIGAALIARREEAGASSLEGVSPGGETPKREPTVNLHEEP